MPDPNYNTVDVFETLLAQHCKCTNECVANECVCSQDELSNDIESLLQEITDVQTRLLDLPDESLGAMETGLKVSFIVNTSYTIPFMIVRL